MELACPRCHTSNHGVARFCGHCGMLLESMDGGPLVAGRMRHPEPLSAPDGFLPCGLAANLFFHTESAWGGKRLLGTEGLTVTLFNGGYALEDVVLEVRGEDQSGQDRFVLHHRAGALPRGQRVASEVPSYELAEPVRAIRVSLASAEYASDE